jgi:nucleoid-associated protein YgaU
MPDRAVGPAHHRTHQPADHSPARDRSVVVRAGDCLWRLAEQDLPAGATAPQVAAHWRAIYRLNRTLVGADPNLIHPGQRLTLPR